MCEWTDRPGTRTQTTPSINIETTPTNMPHPAMDSSPPACADPYAAVPQFASFVQDDKLVKISEGMTPANTLHGLFQTYMPEKKIFPINFLFTCSDTTALSAVFNHDMLWRLGNQ